ncbi:MAG TPA: MBL fold metallo-hydrolase [Dehalococcoidia bacterium]|nr:MBL fold metallo-hydrolase [Dehalococcoidia bacterium]
MWIKDPGKVIDRLDFLGTHENCLYLLRGKEAMIIGGGMSWIAPSLERQLSAMDFEPDRLRYLVITHSHFDHCGAVPYLKRIFPHIQVLASAHSEEVFSKEKAVNFIAAANKQMIDRLGLQSEYERLNLKFDGIQIDRVVAEKDIVDLGDGIEAHFMEVPGHTQCSIAAYIPNLKTLFPSDAAPWPADDVDQLHYPSPQYDFSMYRESLQKLAGYKIEICAFEHHGVVMGGEARKVLHLGLSETDKYKSYVIELYQQIGDLDKIAQEVAVERLKRSKVDSMGMELAIIVSKAEIRNILRDAKLLAEASAP